MPATTTCTLHKGLQCYLFFPLPNFRRPRLDHSVNMRGTRTNNTTPYWGTPMILRWEQYNSFTILASSRHSESECRLVSMRENTNIHRIHSEQQKDKGFTQQASMICTVDTWQYETSASSGARLWGVKKHTHENVLPGNTHCHYQYWYYFCNVTDLLRLVQTNIIWDKILVKTRSNHLSVYS